VLDRPSNVVVAKRHPQPSTAPLVLNQNGKKGSSGMAIVNARFHNWTAAQIIMLLNAAFFGVGAVLHLGIQVGPLTEPRIVPATVVETICALALVAGALAPLYASGIAAAAAVTANIVALAGISLGAIALALGAGPRTVSNDIYHLIMTLLALAALWLVIARERRNRR
jgi:hypothetical protein